MKKEFFQLSKHLATNRPPKHTSTKIEKQFQSDAKSEQSEPNLMAHDQLNLQKQFS